MVLLYTGAEVSNKPQPDPSRSLGGLVSNTPIANDKVSNLFSPLTRTTVIENRKEIRMLALKNTLGVGVTSVRIWTDIGTSSSKLQIAAVAAATNECGEPVFEQVFDDSAIPFQATLEYHEGEANAIAVGNIAAGAVIGIWIRREVDLTKFPNLIPDPDNPLTCQQLADLLTQIQNAATQDETVQLIIDWA